MKEVILNLTDTEEIILYISESCVEYITEIEEIEFPFDDEIDN